MSDCANNSNAVRQFATWSCIAILGLMAAVAHSDGILYLIDGTNLYTVDRSTAALTLVGPAFDDGLSPGTSPSRLLFCADNNPDLYALPVGGGGQTYLATIAGDANRGLAYNLATGLLYGTDNHAFGIIDPTNGAFTPLSSPADELEALAADSDRNLIYGLTTNAGLIAYWVAEDLWLEPPRPTGVGEGGKAGLAYDPRSKTLYAGDTDGFLYSIDPFSAATTVIGSTGISSGLGLAYVPSEIFADGFESGNFIGWTPCGAPTCPVANFVWASNGLEVSFASSSFGAPPLSHVWDFGDGFSSTEEDPVHTYLAPGTYSVTLQVFNLDGTDWTTKSVTVEI